jgi:hypothetical protein
LGRGKANCSDELAKASRIHRDHIGRLERVYEGESRPPTICKLAEALKVDPHDLLSRTMPKPTLQGSRLEGRIAIALAWSR